MDRGNHSRRRYTSFQTDMGWVALLATDSGIARFALPEPTEKAALAELELRPGDTRVSPDAFAETVERVRQYMRGEKVNFAERLDLSAGTAFQRSVWEECGLVPYGQTTSYGRIARELGKPGASRAVGNALGKNPIPLIVPCHRVLASDGGLGGFSGGLAAKRRLLKLEGVRLKKLGRE